MNIKKKVLLTGASRGIGEAILKLLTEEKYFVVAPSRTELDMSNNASIDLFITKFKNENFDILINNAGVNSPKWIDEITDDNITQTFQVNLIGPLRLIRGFIPQMKKKKSSKIINISSIFGIIARGKQSLYSSSKHGLNGLTKALAIELGPYNILVNSICPGFTNTDLVKRNASSKNEALAAEIPLGRFAEPIEIAKLVSFLISDNNTYITGETLKIDGGYTIK